MRLDSEYPQVALAFMNETHAEEINMVQDVLRQIDSMGSNADTAAISAQLERWLAHTQAHFQRENTMMQDIHFPMYPVHAGEHSRVLAELEAVLAAWTVKPDKAELRDYIENQWQPWFEQHVSTMDTVTAQFAVMQGWDPDMTLQDWNSHE